MKTKAPIRVMVDMSVSLIHHGHIRLLKKAKNYFEDENVELVVGLTSDEEIKSHKGFTPELPFNHRKEVLEAISYVDEVVPTTWLITEDIISKYAIDYLVHGSDNSNTVKNIIEFPRTDGVSSEEMRDRALSSIIQQRNSQKPMFTPGPSNLSINNVLDIRSVFGRDDDEYTTIEETVLENILNITGHDHITRMQGSATTAIDVATSNFVLGNVLIVVSGYYSKRLIEIYNRKLDQLPHKTVITIISYDAIKTELNDSRTFDWIATSYTETADGFLSDINLLHQLKQAKQAKLFLDATASINLEDHHDLADACAFSSCKGLGGLTGAGFIAYNDGCLLDHLDKNIPWSLDIYTYINKMTTGPYHAICSLYTISKDFDSVKNNVRKSKALFIEKYSNKLVRASKDQPNLCTLFYADSFSAKKGIEYSPRAVDKGQVVVCHLGDMFTENELIGDIYSNLDIK